jgi:hypothetical protein
MSATIKKILTFSLIAVLLIAFSDIASAKKKQGPVWHAGTVTKAAWTEGQDKCIEVDNDKYTFLSDDRAKITRQYQAANGQWKSETLPLNKVYVGTGAPQGGGVSLSISDCRRKVARSVTFMSTTKPHVSNSRIRIVVRRKHHDTA